MPADAPAPDGRQPVVRIKTPEEGCTSWKEPELLGMVFFGDGNGSSKFVEWDIYIFFFFLSKCFSDGDVWM